MQSHKLLLSTTIAVLLVLISGLLLERAAPALAGAGTDILGPVGSVQFGKQLVALPNGNIVVLDPGYNGNAGAVYLYNGATAALISALTGGSANDRVGNNGITVLANGNFVVSSPFWGGMTGAATWCSAAVGCNGNVSGLNSLVGTNAGDGVGSAVTALPNGSYVVQSYIWNGHAGAATWGPAAGGVTGGVSAANSMVGSNNNDGVASGITILSNGSYVVQSQAWNGGMGAATWCSASAPCAGLVSAANSLVGSNANDYIGSGVTALSNGNYVVNSTGWDGRGAATWGSGTTGITGVVAPSNSFVGLASNDQVGLSVALPNGNYVLMEPLWNNTQGAVTWANGTTGITGVVSAGNSLLGSSANDEVGWIITVLGNGSYVVQSPYWNGNRGAVTWAGPSSALTGTVSAANSLVGSSAGDQVGGNFHVLTLTNGNYVALSPAWTTGGQSNAGAVTWGNGTSGITGAVSAANSLVGSSTGDDVGLGGTALPNGNYVIASNFWNGNAGAVTWGSGTAGVTGTVSAANSLVGSSANDAVGSNVTVLDNGNYVAYSYTWNNSTGAATWCSANSGCSGLVSAGNSLVGSSAGDQAAAIVMPLRNGSYVVESTGWSGQKGAATWGSGTGGITGTISAANSLVGSSAGDLVGYRVVALANGSYIVLSRNWGGQRGAVTWGSGAGGISGPVAAGNSLVGSSTGDAVGYQGGTALPNGNYVAVSKAWAHGVYTQAGAITLGLGDGMTTGPVTSSNSVLGGVTGGGFGLNWAYDPVHNQIAVGRPAENIVTLFINKAQAAMSISANPNPSGELKTVTFTAVLTSALITPTGAVRFYADGSAVLTVTLAGGRAVWLTNTLSLGTHPITASYGGDLNFAPATAALAGGQHVIVWKLFLPLLRRH